ncbi:MAG: hypothetical protein COZ05_20900 [Armatimonadetes bacterium CG_4_10_14_3_um_filter_59_10]|nr:MAG: hypothetical protein COZ05_20900 [Armatimonadetes bacterium CG_4_10_14_3_um_filter_59_10]
MGFLTQLATGTLPLFSCSHTPRFNVGFLTQRSPSRQLQTAMPHCAFIATLCELPDDETSGVLFCMSVRNNDIEESSLPAGRLATVPLGGMFSHLSHG